jgi:hypothetical protein
MNVGLRLHPHRSPHLSHRNARVLRLPQMADFPFRHLFISSVNGSGMKGIYVTAPSQQAAVSVFVSYNYLEAEPYTRANFLNCNLYVGSVQ